MNIIVFGGQGYLGTHLTHLLKKRNFKVYIVDDCSNVSNTFYKKFYRSFDSLPKKKYDIFINLASKAYVHESKIIPYTYFKNNIESLIKSLDFCSKLKIDKYIYISSCSVYDENISSIKENSSINPKSPYGKSKIICENIVKNYAEESQIKYLIFRPFNITGSLYPNIKYGETHFPETHLIPNLVLSCLYKKKINIFASKIKHGNKLYSNVRDYIHVQNVCQIIINAIQKRIFNNTFNIGSGKGYSTIEILKKVEKFTNNDCHYKIVNLHKCDNLKLVANISKIKKFGLIKKTFSIDDIIKSNIKWFESKKFKEFFVK